MGVPDFFGDKEAVTQCCESCLRLERALRRACEKVADCTGSCPLDSYDWQPPEGCEECKDTLAACWQKYFLEEADHDL